jgi:hypothetical protein
VRLRQYQYQWTKQHKKKSVTPKQWPMAKMSLLRTILCSLLVRRKKPRKMADFQCSKRRIVMYYSNKMVWYNGEIPKRRAVRRERNRNLKRGQRMAQIMIFLQMKIIKWVSLKYTLTTVKEV